MRLQSFQIRNYRSIIDSGVVNLSEIDNVTVLAGQNESGKSSILRALNDYEQQEFELDSLPFSIGDRPVQTISCTYKVDSNDDFCKRLSEIIIEERTLQVTENEAILDDKKINSIDNFTITSLMSGDQVSLEINKEVIEIFQSAILEKPSSPPTDADGKATNPQHEKYFTIVDEEINLIADYFWKLTPKIVFFDDFCDLLPDKIFISDLRNNNEAAEGYRAVRNLEKILKTNFIDKDSESDAVRGTKQRKENEVLSIDFQTDWGQRIHDENQVDVKYTFEKRNGEGETGSYINFFVETKRDQPLPPKQRSKGLIWFLSLWLELKAQDVENNDLILLLDEPDQHLHVKAQNDILKLINKLSGTTDDESADETNGDQIVYATHSPYLIESDRLNRIKLVYNSNSDGTKIEDITTSKINTENKKDALQPIADAIGLGVSDFSILGKQNVILEGVSDLNYFLAMRRLLGRDGQYSFVPGIGVRQINNLISFALGYGLDWIAIIDDDPSIGGTDSKNKFNEIKDSVFDGDEEKTKERVHVLENIVGIENMFTVDDLKLVDTRLGRGQDMTKVVGKRRKVLFSKLFLEKVEGGQITLPQLSQTANTNFTKAFDFIEGYFQ